MQREDEILTAIGKLETEVVTIQTNLSALRVDVCDHLHVIEERVKSDEAALVLVRQQSDRIDTRFDALEKRTDGQDKVLSSIAAGIDGVTLASKRVFANPVVRTLITMMGAFVLTWAAGHGCSLPVPLEAARSAPVLLAPSALPVSVPIVMNASSATDLTPFERDVAACGQSAACEESVRARYGRPRHEAGSTP